MRPVGEKSRISYGPHTQNPFVSGFAVDVDNLVEWAEGLETSMIECGLGESFRKNIHLVFMRNNAEHGVIRD